MLHASPFDFQPNSGDRPAWKMVYLGLRLKLAAWWCLVFAPVVLIVLWALNVGMGLGVCILLSAALIIDAIGRICCLSCPGISRKLLMASVAIQCAAIVAAVVFVVGLRDYLPAGITIAISILVAGQAMAAFLYTEFLRLLSQHVGRPDLAELSRKVRSGFLSNLLAIWPFVPLTIVVGVIICVLTLIGLWFGFYLGLAIGILVLLPFGIIWLMVIVSMLGRYGQLLYQLQKVVSSKF